MTAPDLVGWEPLTSPGPDLEPLDGPTTADVVVVGLGASGLTACRHLAERGSDVVGVDAVGIAAGAAGRNGGFLLTGGARFHHDAVATWGREVAVALHRATDEELERTLADLETAEPGTIVSRSGSLRVAAAPGEDEDIAAQLAAMRADGLAAEAYEGPEGVGLLVVRDAACNPVARSRHLARRAIGAGARLHAPARVTHLDGTTVVLTGGVTVAADRVIVAVDGGLERLLPELGGRVRTSRLQMLATAADHGVTFTRPVYRRWGYDYVQQAPTGEVLLGGGRDRSADEEWGAPAEPSAALQGYLDDLLRRLDVTAPVTHRWAAHAAFTADGLPVCEELRDGVYVVGGYSGHGNLIGTLAARRAADAALDALPLRLLET